MKTIELVMDYINKTWGNQAEVLSDQFFQVIKVPAAALPELFTQLKEVHGFNYLANLTAVDYRDHFELVYHIYSIPDNRKLAVKADVDHEQPIAPSAVSIWPTADWQEREVFDLMGISFAGHPNLKRVLLPEEFEGHPLRKDFEMKG